MAISLRLEYPKFKVLHPTTNLPVASGKAYFYEPNTTTDKNVYPTKVDAEASTNALPQPLILDAAGEANVFGVGEYTVKVDDANDVNIATYDNVNIAQVSTTDVYGNNLLPNGSFELYDSTTSINDWTSSPYTSGTIAIDTTDPNHGDVGLLFSDGGSGGGTFTSTNFINISPSTPYTFTIDLKSNVATVRNTATIEYFDKDDVSLSTATIFNDTATNPIAWTNQQYFFTTAASAVKAKVTLVGCHSSAGNAGNSTRYDNVVLREHVGVELLETAGTTVQTIATPLTIAGAVIGSSTLTVTGASTLTGAVTAAALVTANLGVTVAGAGVQIGAPTGGDKGAGTLNSALHIYHNNTKVTADAIGGFVKGHVTYIENDTGSSALFNVSANVSAAAWESIGPTGSGATNAWTVLDLISGTTTATTANKLEDSSETFITKGVAIGQKIYNTTDTTTALVTAIDSETVLSVDTDVFASGENYTIALIPPTATFIILNVFIYTTGSTTGQNYLTKLYTRVTGSSASAGDASIKAYADVLNRSGASETDGNFNTVFIPIDTSGRFDLHWTESGTNVTSAVQIYHIGWGE